MAGTLERFLKVLTPKRTAPGGTSVTNTFSPTRTNVLQSTPTYREHLTDVFTTRASSDSMSLLQVLFVQDPDVSAAVNAFLTVANTEPVFTVLDAHGQLDRVGMQSLNAILALITSRYDYNSQGFAYKQSIRSLAESMRYMLLLRGGIGEELVFDKNQLPVEIRHVDMNTIRWFEKAPGYFVPQQRSPTDGALIDLDIPTFFTSYFRRDPTTMYTYSPFVSSINTVAARQQVINDLYRIMKTTGFPRIEATVVEEVLRKNAPTNIRNDAAKMQAYIATEFDNIKNLLSNTTADQALVHSNSMELGVFNDTNPTNALNIDSIIGALNAMNQAGLRSMATILGRGESGVNTASVEARIFSMNAESLNEPIGEVLSQMLTMALRITGKTDSRVECRFLPVELRPWTELEPQLTMRASRLRQDLSDGIITDDEYHLEMYNRIRPDSAPILQGTGFMAKSAGLQVDAQKITPNSDPLGKSLAPPGSKFARGSNVTKKTAK